MVSKVKTEAFFDPEEYDELRVWQRHFSKHGEIGKTISQTIRHITTSWMRQNREKAIRPMENEKKEENTPEIILENIKKAKILKEI